MCIIADYKVWYRSADQSQVQDLSSVAEREIKSMTLEEFALAASVLDVTQLYVRGNIPPNLNIKTLNLRCLQVKDLPNKGQFERSVVLLYPAVYYIVLHAW